MSEYVWYNELSKDFLEKDYLLPGQTLDERVDIICNTAEKLLKKPGFAAKLKRNIKKGWYSLSTPVWSNFGTDRGTGVSCFSSYMSDDSDSIIGCQAEVCKMSKLGGGTAAYFGKLRERGALIQEGRNGESSGPVHFMGKFEKSIGVWSQSSVRRGSFAAYLDIDHPDIVEFLGIKSEGHPVQDISFAVCVHDEWMESMIAGDMDKRTIWAKVIDARRNTGYPYILFVDTVNNNTVDVYKDKGMRIHASNLCIEALLPTDDEESFVCVLSSMNVARYDEWKDDPEAVELLVYLLEAVTIDFVNRASRIRFMERAVKFAEQHRALGIGIIGWHSYLQSKMIPFESMEAKRINVQIAKQLKKQTYAASAKCAEEYGETELLKGYGRRHTTLMAYAPNTSSAFIIEQVSQGIEPFKSNYYIKDLAKGKYTVRNAELIKLLESKNKNTDEVWNSILKRNGSVQHLDCLTSHEKEVFKTFRELSQMEVVIQAAQRQKYIDQGQSLNVTIHSSIPTKDINALLIEGWRLGIKSFYYQLGVNAAKEFARDINACSSCAS